MNFKDKFIKTVDIEYSLEVAKKLEKFRSNLKLGFRTAGSRAEFEAGEMLVAEMRKIGISDVSKDKITVDGWEFRKADLRYRDKQGVEREVILGAYQTDFVTEGFKNFKVVYLNKGVESDYEDVDVVGKIVLLKINQRDEWWINYPVYQAYLKGAVAVIAFQVGGYGEIDEEALNAQDIAGPSDAAAFSISVEDARGLIDAMDENDELDVRIDAVTKVMKDVSDYNIVGVIHGKHSDRKILLSAHYDSYFNGFQDDNTAIGMMLSIGRTLVKMKYQPENDIILCAMAAEEWGVTDSQFDWSTGAYEEVFNVHPEWRGKVIADINFELPALAHGSRARIRSTNEYAHFLEQFLQELPTLTSAYPDKTTVVTPIETWSDDFTISISGIPSMVNDFSGGNFMKNNYHSQFDNDGFYDEKVYKMNHELFGCLLLDIDNTAIVPLDFTRGFERALKKLDVEFCEETGVNAGILVKELNEAIDVAWDAYKVVDEVNEEYLKLLQSGKIFRAKLLYDSNKLNERTLLKLFKQSQDEFVKLNWYGEVEYPHEIICERLEYINNAIDYLKESNINSALQQIYKMDNNAYAFRFEESVYRHFTDYVFKQSASRLKWGYNRFVGHEDLLYIVKTLLHKRKEKITDYSHEILLLEITAKRQKQLLQDTVNSLANVVGEMKAELETIK